MDFMFKSRLGMIIASMTTKSARRKIGIALLCAAPLIWGAFYAGRATAPQHDYTVNVYTQDGKINSVRVIDVKDHRTDFTIGPEYKSSDLSDIVKDDSEFKVYFHDQKGQ